MRNTTFREVVTYLGGIMRRLRAYSTEREGTLSTRGDRHSGAGLPDRPD